MAVSTTSSGSPDPTRTDQGPSQVEAFERELVSGGDSRISRSLTRAARVLRVLVMAMVATGALGLGLGLVAWRGITLPLVVVVVLCLPAILLPLYVVRRTAALTEAASHPREVAEQAGDLVGRVRHSRELHTLADRLNPAGERPSEPAPRKGRGRIASTVSLARLASSVLGQASPDKDRHPLLVPFTPERLGRMWVALVWSLWFWAASAIVVVVSIPVLLVRLL